MPRNLIFVVAYNHEDFLQTLAVGVLATAAALDAGAEAGQIEEPA